MRAVEDCVSEEEEKQEVDASSRPDCTEEGKIMSTDFQYTLY